MAALLTPADVREHVETDLLDPALQRLIDDADTAIVARFGAHAADGAVVEEHAGNYPLIFPRRPAASITAIAEYTSEPRSLADGAMAALSAALTSASAAFVTSDVGEYVEVEGAGGAGAILRTSIAAYVSATEVTLAAAAATTVAGATFTYGGTRLVANDYEIINGGRELRRRSSGTNQRSTWTDRVKLVYAPADDATRRRRVELDLVHLAIRYEAVKSQAVGDYNETPLDYDSERELLLGELSPALAIS